MGIRVMIMENVVLLMSLPNHLQYYVIYQAKDLRRIIALIRDISHELEMYQTWNHYLGSYFTTKFRG